MNITTAFLSFYAIRNITRSERSAWIMSILYTFATYRLTNLYYRAALGESLAMVFLPLLLWGAYEVFTEKKENGIYWYWEFPEYWSHMFFLLKCVFYSLWQRGFCG